MASLNTPFARINPTERFVYFDAIRIWLQQPIEGPALEYLKAACGGRLHQRTVPMRFNGQYRQCLWLQQPPHDVLHELAKRNDALLTYVEAARDYVFDGSFARDKAAELLAALNVKLYRRDEQARIFVGMFDATNYSGDRKASVNRVQYCCTCRVNGSLYCVHSEARFRGQRTLQRMKIETLVRLITECPGELLDKRQRFYAIDCEKLGRKLRTATGQRSENRRGPAIISKGAAFTYNVDKRTGQMFKRMYGLTSETLVFRAKGASAHELETLHTTQNVIDGLKAHKAYKHIDIRGCLVAANVFANNNEAVQGDTLATFNNGHIIISKPHPRPIKPAKKGM